MTFTKKIFIFCLLTLLSASCAHQQTTKPVVDASYKNELQVGTKKIFVDVANTNESRQQGLSDRKNMDEDQGMIFIFDSETKPAFWMKDMNFDLDLIWINKNKIVGITANAPATIENLPARHELEPKATAGGKLKIENLPLYYPPSSVDQVLEVNSGWAKKNNINVGDDVILKNYSN